MALAMSIGELKDGICGEIIFHSSVTATMQGLSLVVWQS